LASSPGGTLTDFTHFIPLSLITDDDWWGYVRANGGDIRATNTSNTLIPLDVLSIDKSGRTGLVAVKLTQNGTADIRLWVGTGYLSQPAASATAGRYNAYDSSFAGLWLSGYGGNRINGGGSLSLSTGSVPVSVSGPLSGSLGSRYTAPAVGSTAALANLSTTLPLSLIAYMRREATGAGTEWQVLKSSSPISFHLIRAEDAETVAVSFYETGPESGEANIATAITLNTWTQVSGVFTNTASRQVGLNDTYDTDNTNVTAQTQPQAGVAVGNGTVSSLSILQVHSAARSPGIQLPLRKQVGLIEVKIKLCPGLQVYPNGRSSP
jgi:hypothetical protein